MKQKKRVERGAETGVGVGDEKRDDVDKLEGKEEFVVEVEAGPSRKQERGKKEEGRKCKEGLDEAEGREESV